MTDLVNYLFFYNKGEGKELKYGIHYITYIRLCPKTMKAQTADDGTGNSDALYIFMYVYKDAPTSIA